MLRLLLVDDDPHLTPTLITALKARYKVEGVGSVSEARQRMASARFDLYVFDLSLPDGSGLDLIHSVRSQYPEVGILMLTVEDKTTTKIRAFEAGADDYLTKPFSLRELEARLQALSRRVAPREMLRCGDFAYDAGLYLLYRGDTRYELPRKVGDALALLIQNSNRPVLHERLLRTLWNETDAPRSNVVAVYIRKLRQLIEKPAGPQFIRTIPGVGYALMLGERSSYGRSSRKDAV